MRYSDKVSVCRCLNYLDRAIAQIDQRNSTSIDNFGKSLHVGAAKGATALPGAMNCGICFGIYLQMPTCFRRAFIVVFMVKRGLNVGKIPKPSDRVIAVSVQMSKSVRAPTVLPHHSQQR